MPQRRNKSTLVHEKLKRAKPLDLVQFNVKIPAYLMSDVKTYGCASKIIRSALELANKRKFANRLLEKISDIKLEIELLENWKEAGREEIDQDHLQLIELYKDIYFRLKKARILRAKKP